MQKDKALVKEVTRELKLPTKETISSDDDTNLTKLSSKNEFMETAGAAMKAYCSSIKEQSDHMLIMSLASPQKKIVLDAKTAVMLEEL
jgi:peptidyl-tRNA hydrolase